MARLIVGGKTIEIKDAETVIGRGEDCAVPIAETQASRRHCKIVKAGEGWELQDLQSRNGTLVDGKKVERLALRHGSVIQIGQTSLKFECIDAPPPPTLPGFQITDVIGQGGMGFVYRGKQTSLGRDVAVKVLAAQYANDPAYNERFQREAKMMATLQHPNIVGVIDAGPNYLVMEFVDGVPLQNLAPRPEVEVAKIGVDVARALGFAAERKLVHRDIKPENVLVTKTGQAKLCDMGIAKSLDSSASLTAPDVVMGTANYISPEQARGRPADARSDLYQLGGTLYYGLTGRTPFQGDSTAAIVGQHMNGPVPDPRKIKPDLSNGMAAIVMKLMSKDPDARYSSAAELASDLERVVRGQAPLVALTRKPSEVKDAAKRAAKARKRSTLVMLSVSLLMAIGGAGAIGVVVMKMRDKPAPPPTPVQPDKPKTVDHGAVEREKQKKAFEEAVAAWTRERANVTPDKISALQASLEKRSKPFTNTPYEEEWKKLAEQFEADGQAACRAAWEPIRKQIADRADRGLLLEAVSLFDTVPMEIARGKTNGDIAAFKSEVKSRLESKRKLSTDMLAKADFMAGWDLIPTFEGAFTDAEIRAMRRDWLTRQYEALAAPPLTRAKVSGAEQALREVQKKNIGDSDMVDQVEAAIRRCQAELSKQVTAGEAAHAQSYAALQAKFRALGKERRFCEMRRLLLTVLQPPRKPEWEAFLETVSADVSFLKGDVAVSPKDLIPKIEALKVPPTFAAALADYRDVLLMERLCLAGAEGFKNITEYATLENGFLKHATQLDVERVEAKDVDLAIVVEIVIHQGDNKGNPIKFYLSPVKNPGTLTPGDIAKGAEKEGLGPNEIQLGVALLYFYAGDARAKDMLAKTKDKWAARHLK
jgi:serine/threonine protein kinase